MRIAIIASGYPSDTDPSNGSFVREFTRALLRLNVECAVFNPVSIFRGLKGKLPPLLSQHQIGDGRKKTVYHPRFISFSSKDIFGHKTGWLTTQSFTRCVKRTIQNSGFNPSIVYGHFLYPSGYSATCFASENNLISVIGVGEDSLWTAESIGILRAREQLKKTTYFFSNSTPNKKSLENILGIDPAKILVIPNGVDRSLFYKQNREKLRRKYGLNNSDFIVTFVGNSGERKGGRRLLESIKQNEEIKCILIGPGTEMIASKNVVLCGQHSHAVVSELIACGNVFVLPTLSEGSCNAVVEAMACGVPIVTSNGEFMDDIVDNSVAIRVDPRNIDEIRASILHLKEHPEECAKMSDACIKRSTGFDVNIRASRFINWITTGKNI